MFQFLKLITIVLIFHSLVSAVKVNVELDIVQPEKTDSIKLNVLRDGVVVQKINLDSSYSGGEFVKHSLNENEFVIKQKDELGGSDGLQIKYIQMEEEFGIIRIKRILPKGTSVTDCFNLNQNGSNWFGGPQQKYQYWPIQTLKFTNYSYITKEADNCGITERYWLSSSGFFFYVNPETPLFIDQNDPSGYLCFRGEKSLPYDTYAPDFLFEYEMGVASDVKSAHRMAIKYRLGKPTGYPDERMVRHPIWSTWARYKRDIDETVVLEFANEILQHQFNNSQYEIDDDWEICYGALTFRESKFPNIKNLTDTLKAKGFRVTLWIHPFINKDCEPWYSDAKRMGYLVSDYKNNTDTQWWNSGANEASYIDFTNSKAAEWFSTRLKNLQESAGIDSYKFDAGESSWSPPDPNLQGPSPLHPSLITSTYVRTVAKFGPMVEVRSGQGTQDLPIFLRMIDKDSNWDWNNGLPTLVTTLLQLNMVGYPLVLPDMIGGNGYQGAPDKEMFIRWLAANVFMPSLQFSYVPWDYDDETIKISQTFTKLHDQFTDYIMERLKLASENGEPVNPPLWWADPSDKVAQACNDEFMLGDDIIAAPVLEKGATSRDIYLPKGNWTDGITNLSYQGPTTLQNYPVPIDAIPYFLRKK